jgi:hypothetical protein
VAGSCEYGGEISGSGAMELVISVSDQPIHNLFSDTHSDILAMQYLCRLSGENGWNERPEMRKNTSKSKLF